MTNPPATFDPDRSEERVEIDRDSKVGKKQNAI